MARKTIQDLTATSLPAVGTDLVPIARSTSPATKLALSALPISDATQTALNDKAIRVTNLAALVLLTGSTGSTAVVAGRLTSGDGGGGSFAWVTGNQSANVTADTAQGVWVAPTSAPTGASGAWKRIFDGPPLAPWFGALGDGTTNDTTAIQAGIAWAAYAGTELAFPDDGRTYILSPITVAVSVYLIVPTSVTLKLADNSAMVGSFLSMLTFTADNSGVIGGGTLDFNRANQGKAAFNAAGGAANRFYYCVRAVGSAGDYLTGFQMTPRIINSADFGFYGIYLSYPAGVIDVSASGAGVSLVSCTLDGRLTVRPLSLDNDGWKVYPHAFDTTNCVGLVYWDNADQYGDDNTGTGGSLSDWVTGLTMVGCDLTVRGGVNSYRNAVGTKGLGFSVMTSAGSRIEGYTADNWTDTVIESDGSVEFVDIKGDSGWLASANSGTGWGVQCFTSQFPTDFLGRYLTAPAQCRYENVVMTRCLRTSWRLGAAQDFTLVNCGGTASLDGMEIEYSAGASNALFPSAPAQVIRRINVIGGDFSFNERDGIQLADGADVVIAGSTRLLNNGQAITQGGTSRAGIAVTTGHGLTTAGGTQTKTGNVYSDIIAYDDQSSVGLFGSANPASPYVVTCPDAARFNIGQGIELEGCGTAGVDLVSYVVSKQGDDITIAHPIVTFPLTAGAGTISTSGTTVTGSGTAFLTAAQKRVWIKAGGNYRLLISATTDTAGVLQSAFSPNLSGSAYEFCAIVVNQVRSQTYGVNLGSTDLNPLLLRPNFGTHGNVTANILDQTTTADSAWIEAAEKPIWIPAAAWTYQAGAASILNSTNSRTSGWALDATTPEEINTVLRLPADAPKAMRVVIVWANNGAGAGDVALVFRFRSAGDGETTNSPFTSLSATITALGQDLVKESDMGVMTLTTTKQLFMQILRNASSGSDTLANDILIYGAWLIKA